MAGDQDQDRGRGGRRGSTGAAGARALRLRHLVTGLIVVLVIGGCCAFGPRYVGGLIFVADRGCTEGPTKAPASQTRLGGSYSFPYGDVRSCRVLKREGNLTGAPGSVHLLLDTDAGLVVVRVDYSDISAGRWWRAEAYEIGPVAVPRGLTGAEFQRLSDDVAARGGVRREPWVLRSGDG